MNEKKEPSHSDENEINQKEQLETEFKTDMVERFKIWLVFILFIYLNAIFVKENSCSFQGFFKQKFYK